MNENENEILEGKAEPTNKEKLSNISQYHAYEYFKHHSSAFFAIASAVVAIISLVLNFAAFLSTNSYLMYFRVDNVAYRASIQFIYLFAISLIFFAVIILFQGFLSKTFDVYLPYKKKLLLYKYYFKKNKKDIEYGKKMRTAIRENLIETSDSIADDKKTQTEKNLTWLSESAKKIESEYKSIKKDVRKWRIAYYILLVLSCILVWGVLSIASILLLSIASYEWDNIISSAMIFSVLFVLIGALENWFLSCVLRVNRKKIKADANLDKKEVLPLYSDLPEFPISSILDGNFKSFLSDSNCKRFIATIMLCLTLVVMVSSWSGVQSAKTQKAFFVLDDNDQTYVLIYNNGESAILEKAEINGNNIIIDTTHQKIVSSIGLDMKKYEYESVEIVRTRKDSTADKIETAETNDVPETSETDETVEDAETTEPFDTTDIYGGD